MTRGHPELQLLHGGRTGSRGRGLLPLWTVVAALLLLVSACSSPFGDDDDDDDKTAADVVASPSPAATSTPSATATPTTPPTPTVTPSPTEFVPPTVAVEEDDSVQACLERNISGELLVSLSLEQTELTEDIFRTCLEQSIPAELMFLLDPIIEDASECAVDISHTLTNEQLVTLAGPDSPAKDALIEEVINDILGCVGEQYGISF